MSLKRAKEARLEICLDGDSVRISPGFPDTIAPYPQNTKTLQFSPLTTIEDLTRALPNFPQSMPNLRSLELIDSHSGSNWDPSLDPFEPFSDALRKISLDDIPLYRSFLQPRTLTEFSLQYSRIYPPLDTLLDFLEDPLFEVFESSLLRHSSDGIAGVLKVRPPGGSGATSIGASGIAYGLSTLVI